MADSPLELFAEGRLGDALRRQQEVVDARPDDAGRLLLAELLLFDGQFDEVHKQIDLVPALRDEMKAYVRDYHLLLDAEVRRQELMKRGTPTLLSPASKHVKLRLAALDALRRNQQDEAQELLDEAEDAAPPVAGHVDGREFEVLRDTDELFGPVFEALSHGDYLWIPAEQVRTLRLHPRQTPRDLYFAPASMVTHGGQRLDLHLPGLYAGTHLHDDGDLRTGQATDWHAEPGGPVRGAGLRIFAIGEEELSLQEFTQLELR